MLDYRVLPAGDTALVDRVRRSHRSRAQHVGAVAGTSLGCGANRGNSRDRSHIPLADGSLRAAGASASSLIARIDAQVQKLGSSEIVGHVWHLPVCYDPRFAIDLDEVARANLALDTTSRRTAQWADLSRLHARLPAGPGLYGRSCGRAGARSAGDTAHENSGRLACNRVDACHASFRSRRRAVGT